MDSRLGVSTLSAGYAEELYEQFLSSPASLDEKKSRAFFTRSGAHASERCRRLVDLARLADAIRRRGRGHRAAKIDPLGSEPPGDSVLELEHYSLDDHDLAGLPAFPVGGAAAESANDAAGAVQRLRAI